MEERGKKRGEKNRKGKKDGKKGEGNGRKGKEGGTANYSTPSDLLHFMMEGFNFADLFLDEKTCL